MQNVLLVGIGGFFGALARWYLGGVIAGITGSSFPWGTMLINVTGAFVLGFLFAASTERGIIDPAVRLPVSRQHLLFAPGELGRVLLVPGLLDLDPQLLHAEGGRVESLAREHV